MRDRIESKMPKFEIKNFETYNWQGVSEVSALSILQKNFEQVTPKITEMLYGKEIETPDGILRVKQ